MNEKWSIFRVTSLSLLWCRVWFFFIFRGMLDFYGRPMYQLTVEDFVRNLIDGVESVNFSESKLKRNSYVIDYRPGL